MLSVRKIEFVTFKSGFILAISILAMSDSRSTGPILRGKRKKYGLWFLTLKKEKVRSLETSGYVTARALLLAEDHFSTNVAPLN